MRVRRFYVSRSVASVACHVDLAWIGCVLRCFMCRVGSGAIRGGPLGGPRQLYDRFAAAQRRTRTFGKNTARGGLHGSPRRGPQRRQKHAPTPQQTGAAERAARRGDLAAQNGKKWTFRTLFFASEPCKRRTPPLNRSKVRLRRLGVQPSPCTSIRAAVRAPRSRAEVISQAAQSAKVRLHKVPAA